MHKHNEIQIFDPWFWIIKKTKQLQVNWRKDSKLQYLQSRKKIEAAWNLDFINNLVFLDTHHFSHTKIIENRQANR